MYKPFIKITNNEIIEDYITSTAAKKLKEIVYNASTSFAVSVDYYEKITEDKLNLLIKKLLEGKDVYLVLGKKAYNLKDILYKYLYENCTIGVIEKIDMERLNTFYDNELALLVKQSYPRETIKTLLQHYIILSTVPEYLLITSIDAKASSQIRPGITLEINCILDEILEQIYNGRIN